MYHSTTHPTTSDTPENSSWVGSYVQDFHKPEAQWNVITAQGKQKDYHNLHAKYHKFYPGDAVMIKDLRKDKTWWPGAGTIVERVICSSIVRWHSVEATCGLLTSEGTKF